MARSQTLEDDSGEHLLPFYSSSTSRHDSRDPEDQSPLTELHIDDSDGDAAHQRGSARMRFRYALRRLQARLAQGFYCGADSRKPGVRGRQGSSGGRKWLRRCITLGAGLLITLGLFQLVAICASVLAITLPSSIHRIIRSWGQISQTGDDLSSWPTEFTRDINPLPCHSHNDYWRAVPLYSAVSAGCISVEADIWLVQDSDQDLYVGHSTSSLTRNRTLQSLYIDPLVRILDKQNPTTPFHPNYSLPFNGVFDVNPSQSLTLLLDFKTSGAALWPHVLAQLEPLRSRSYLTYFDGAGLVPGPVTAVCTGECPFDLLLSNTTYRDVFFDAPLQEMWEADGPERNDEETPGERDGGGREGDKIPTDNQPHTMRTPRIYSSHNRNARSLGDAANTTTDPLDAKLDKHTPDQNKPTNPGQTLPPIYSTNNSYYASASFGETIGRMWRNQLSPRQKNLIRGQIRGAHRRGLKVRYWDLPDWPIGWRNHVWEVLIREGVDVLNVDDLEAAARGDWGGEWGNDGE